MTDDLETARVHTLTQKVKTPFGSMYLHVDFDKHGRLSGGSISDPQKEPDTQVAKLIQDLSAGLDQVLQWAGDQPRLPTRPAEEQSEP